jgi:NADH-quinone oxidoreductase subunit C
VGTVERIQPALTGLEHRIVTPRDGLATIDVARAGVREVCARLRDRCGFESSTFVTAIDHFPHEPRFEVVWQFRSLEHGDRVRVQTRVDARDAWVPTIADLWPGAAFGERECYDMFGIRFDGHAGLKRLLMPADYDHFPLRKDFPHQGIEPDRLYREWDQRRRAEHAQHADV